MSFFKSFFACLLAILVSFGVIVILLVGLFAAALSLSESPTDVTENSILYISLSGEMKERTEEDVYGMLTTSESVSCSLQDILKALKNAKTDDRIKGVYIKPGVMYTGYASLEEIRSALLDFKSSGKFVYSYSGSYTQGGYYVASVSDSIFVNPQGVLDFRGIASSSMFYKHLLDTLGVEMQVIKVGTYKSFTEQYSNDTMSEPNRRQTEELVSSLWTSVLKDISHSRTIDTTTLNQLANKMMAFQLPEVALQNRMVDRLCYADEVETSLRNQLSLQEDEEISFVTVEDYVSYDDLAVGDEKIAVLYAEGEIDDGNTDGISSAKMVSELRKIAKDSTIKAMVIRVNSPGGSAYGAEQIWHAVELVKKEKPVIVSMGDYAASGGYYLSSGADVIYADEKTITGSIGVFSVIPNVDRLMKKIGVSQQVVKTNEYSDVLSNFTRPLDENEKNMLQNHVAAVYNVFLKRCSDGRNMSVADVEKIAEGRVWSGVDAKRIGLVDEIGTLEDAEKAAAEKLGKSFDEISFVEYPEKKDIWSQLTELPHIGYERIFGSDAFSKEKEILRHLQSMDYDQAILPYSIEVK